MVRCEAKQKTTPWLSETAIATIALQLLQLEDSEEGHEPSPALKWSEALHVEGCRMPSWKCTPATRPKTTKGSASWEELRVWTLSCSNAPKLGSAAWHPIQPVSTMLATMSENTRPTSKASPCRR